MRECLFHRNKSLLMGKLCKSLISWEFRLFKQILVVLIDECFSTLAPKFHISKMSLLTRILRQVLLLISILVLGSSRRKRIGLTPRLGRCSTSFAAALFLACLA